MRHDDHPIRPYVRQILNLRRIQMQVDSIRGISWEIYPNRLDILRPAHEPAIPSRYIPALSLLEVTSIAMLSTCARHEVSRVAPSRRLRAIRRKIGTLRNVDVDQDG